MATKILYITHPKEDYLQDSILIGLRNTLGCNLIDRPQKQVMYDGCTKKNLYGKGFTLWKNLPDIDIDRNQTDFDTIIFGRIWRQEKEFNEFSFNKNKAKLYFLDGEDHGDIFLPAIEHGSYFKRELTPSSFKNVYPINFSIPQSRLRYKPSPKIKTFAKHVQCREAYKIKEIRFNGHRRYAWLNEADYYQDIALSRYAITMKKAGWDCMRHYEIAANQTVPCFYGLSKKPKQCAPHGLIDMENVIAFNSAKELEEKIVQVKDYKQLQRNAFEWAKANTCENVVKRIGIQWE